MATGEPDISLKSTIRLTDLTRLVGERRHVELQLLRLEQALLALQTDANLNGTLKPERNLTSDANDSMAAVEVMIGALKQRRMKLSQAIEQCRHKHHDAATEIQEQREMKILMESEAAMREHLNQSQKVNAQQLKKISTKNSEHQYKVSSISAQRQIETSKAIQSLHQSIVERDKRDAEKKRKRDEEKALRFAEYCQQERERTLRLFEMEAAREEKQAARRVRYDSVSRSSAPSPSPLPPMNKSSANAKEVDQSSRSKTSMGNTVNTIRDLNNSRSRNVSPTLLTAPPRGATLAQKLDESDAQHLQRHTRSQSRLVAKLEKARLEEEARRAVHTENEYKKAVKRLAESDAKRSMLQERIDTMKKEQSVHVENVRLERGKRLDEAMRRSKVRDADFRWSKRAQRLIDTVCSEVLQSEDQ